jgi:hypothetical protein
MFNGLDQLSYGDLVLLQRAFAQLATVRNRLAVDILVRLSAEVVRRHEGMAIDGYSDDELAAVLNLVMTAIDAAREHGASDELPIMQTLLQLSTAVIGELAERGCVISQLQ